MSLWRDFHLSRGFQKVSDVGEGEYESATGKIQRMKAFDFDQVYPVSSFLIIGGAIKNLQTYEKSPSWGGGISTENKIVPHPPKKLETLYCTPTHLLLSFESSSQLS